MIMNNSYNYDDYNNGIDDGDVIIIMIIII